jgi:hypothetical protein
VGDRNELKSLRTSFGFQARGIELFASSLEQFRASVDAGFASCEQVVDEYGQMARRGFHGSLVRG